ncbi:MAG: phosphopyruvate hydratase [Bdellovibrionales bacterium]
MAKIQDLRAREILDSRGNPTVEVDLVSTNGMLARAMVPSGASTGTHEALELRDGDKSRYLGKGVLKAVEHVNTDLRKLLLGESYSDFKALDKKMLELDGTENKSTFGANAILGLSLAAAKLGAMTEAVPLFHYLGGDSAVRLPAPLMNIINGGAHATNGLDVQEFMIVPVGADTFSEGLRCGAEIFHQLKKLLMEKNLATGVGDEGGFAPVLSGNLEAMELVAKATERAGYKLGDDVCLALDVAATELYDDGKYDWDGKKISSEELGEIYASWSKKFPLISIEDGFSEDDWPAWIQFQAKYGDKIQTVGDDLFVTNPKRIKRGIEEKAANALLVKVNQIGSLSETIEAVDLCHKNNFQTVMSHRSGETEDAIIADLAVGLGSSQIKTGSLCRGERTAKYNQLLRIEEFLGEKAQYTGSSCFRR